MLKNMRWGRETSSLYLMKGEKMENYKKNNEQEYSRRKLFYRVLLGIKQFIDKPLLNIIWLIIVIGNFIAMKTKNILVHNWGDGFILFTPVNICMNIILVIFAILSVLGTIQIIGYFTAKNDEAKMYEVFVKNEGTGNTYKTPILTMKKTNNGVTIREFYSNCTMDEWKRKSEEICEIFNEHFLGEIKYGGKNNNTSYLKKFETGKGIKTDNRGVLYDDIF